MFLICLFVCSFVVFAAKSCWWICGGVLVSAVLVTVVAVGLGLLTIDAQRPLGIIWFVMYVVSCMFTFTISKRSLVFTLWFVFTILHRSWRTTVTVNANWGVKNKGGLGWECVKPISNLLNLVFYIKKALVGTNSWKTCQCFSYIHLTFMPTIVSCIVHAIALQCQHMHNTYFSLHIHFYYCYYYIP